MSSNGRCIRKLACYFIVGVASLSATAQKSGPPQENSPCRRFVQEFYDWYVPFTQKNMNGPTFDTALKRKPTVFSPTLLRALKADSEAQARAQEIVGIDFDPFVSSQDPADHYDVRQARIKNDKCYVEIWRDSARDTSAKTGMPDVIAELRKRAGKWQFVNFRYPDLKSDLMTALAGLRKQRSKP